MPLDNYKSSSVNKVERQFTLHVQNSRIKLWTLSVPNLSLNICSKFQSAVLRIHLQDWQEIRGF